MVAKFEQWVGVANTARNWNTVLKLANSDARRRVDPAGVLNPKQSQR